MPTSAKPRDLSFSALAKSGASVPRILAADDQQHILEAIELLLKRSPAVPTTPS
jgi:5-enolpyruvylshikimate-3-phosphate synthase